LTRAEPDSARADGHNGREPEYWSSAPTFATTEQWQRGYEDIVHFECSLALEGTVLVELWLHISAEEQLRRFESRRVTIR
jgi:hypothetical protein